MIAVWFAIVGFLAAMAGGLFALKYRRHLHHVLGLTAGILMGVVIFDLLPEIFEIVHAGGYDPTIPMIGMMGGFLAFHILEKMTHIHTHVHEEERNVRLGHPAVGQLSAAAIASHTFLDGVAIGLAFQVNAAIGLAVALAVVAHNFSDGLNTVGLMLAHKNSPRKSLQLLLVVALAAPLGAASTLLFTLPEPVLLAYLGISAGFLLYIGASDVLPEASTKHPSRLTLAMTMVGAVFIFTVTKMAGI
ncbi:MAG TPA: ZIP family metal transporter [Candidatus Dormibacteraeota bacterium]|nr:ZIP family metal transporter [Candidatus Dormibacteraeota bacterium]